MRQCNDNSKGGGVGWLTSLFMEDKMISKIIGYILLTISTTYLYFLILLGMIIVINSIGFWYGVGIPILAIILLCIGDKLINNK